MLATDRYIAADGVEAVEIDYDPLPVVVDPKKALLPDAPVLRTDKKDKKDNHIWHWEWGNREATDQLFSEAEVTVKEDIYIPRIHVSSIETCGCVAHFDKVKGKLTVWMTTQAPHAIRTVFALVAGHVGLSEEKIQIISPDIGGGFGGKVPVYPGYVIAVAASVLTGKPVKWIEDRMENLQADSFARDYHITAELAGKKDGTLTALRIKTHRGSRLHRRGRESLEVSRRTISCLHRLIRSESSTRRSRWRLHEQTAGWHCVSLFVPRY